MMFGDTTSAIGMLFLYYFICCYLQIKNFGKLTTKTDLQLMDFISMKACKNKGADQLHGKHAGVVIPLSLSHKPEISSL